MERKFVEMKREDMKRNKELNKLMNKVNKVTSKKYKLSKKDYMLFLVKQDIIYLFFPAARIRESDLKAEISVKITYKPLWTDDLLWDILGMPANKDEPMSLRAVGAFTACEMKIAEYTIILDAEDELTVQRTLDEQAEHFLSVIGDYNDERYRKQLLSSELYKAESSLVFIHEKKYDEARKLLSESKGNGGFIVGGKSYKELALEYINNRKEIR